MTAAQNEVNRLAASVSWHRSMRDSYYRTYRSWVRKSCGWSISCGVTRAAKISYYWGKYTYHRGMVTSVGLLKSAADTALRIARDALAAPQAILSTANAGVTRLLAELDTLAAITADVQARLEALPEIEGTLKPIVTIVIDNGDVTGTVVGDWNGQQITEGRVTFGANPVACLTIPTMGELCTPL